MIFRVAESGIKANGFASGFFRLDSLGRSCVTERPRHHIPGKSIVGFLLNGHAKLGDVLHILVVLSQNTGNGHVRFWKLWIDSQSLSGQLFGALKMEGIGIQIAIIVGLGVREPSQRGGVVRIEFQSRLKMLSCRFERRRLIFMHKKRATHEEFLVGLGILGVPAKNRLLLLRAEMEVQGFGYFEGGLFLKRKYILQIAGEIVSPGLKAGVGID